ncbi:MAG: NAD(+) diphosphatase [Maritimibacter sp.]
MIDISQLAFRAGGLDRAAHRRKEAVELSKLPTTKVIAFWRGRPLVSGESGRTGDLALHWLAPDHPLLGLAAPEVLFLGLWQGHAMVAMDVSGWNPEIDAADQGPGMAGLDQPAPRMGDLPQDARFTDLRGMLAALTPLQGEVCATARGMFEWHRSHGFCAACGTQSDWAEGGWKRDCPACAREHFPRTDPVAIMLVTDGNNMLLGRSPGWPDGMYSLLAGFIEPGETVANAVAREVMEEAGVPVTDVTMIESQPWPFPSSLMIGCRARATARDITLDPAELEDALWVTREELLQVFSGTHPVINRPRTGAIAQVLMKNWLADSLD